MIARRAFLLGFAAPLVWRSNLGAVVRLNNPIVMVTSDVDGSADQHTINAAITAMRAELRRRDAEIDAFDEEQLRAWNDGSEKRRAYIRARAAASDHAVDPR